MCALKQHFSYSPGPYPLVTAVQLSVSTSEIIQCLSSSVWLFSLSIMPSRSAVCWLPLFSWLNKIHIPISHLLYPFIRSQTLGCCEWCSRHGSADVSSILFSFSLDTYPEVGLPDHTVVLLRVLSIFCLPDLGQIRVLQGFSCSFWLAF